MKRKRSGLSSGRWSGRSFVALVLGRGAGSQGVRYTRMGAVVEICEAEEGGGRAAEFDLMAEGAGFVAGRTVVPRRAGLVVSRGCGWGCAGHRSVRYEERAERGDCDGKSDLCGETGADRQGALDAVEGFLCLV